MSFTFNEWDVRDHIATPTNPYIEHYPYNVDDIEDCDKAAEQRERHYQFNQWVKTQLIPAPGVQNGVYKIDDVEVVPQHKRWDDEEWSDGNVIHIGLENQQILRLKSHLISTKREIKAEENEVDFISIDELESLRSKVSELYLNGFLYEDQYQTIGNAIDKQLKEFGIDTDEHDI